MLVTMGIMLALVLLVMVGEEANEMQICTMVADDGNSAAGAREFSVDGTVVPGIPTSSH
jgi:hypothetical protein